MFKKCKKPCRTLKLDYLPLQSKPIYIFVHAHLHRIYYLPITFHKFHFSVKEELHLQKTGTDRQADRRPGRKDWVNPTVQSKKFTGRIKTKRSEILFHESVGPIGKLSTVQDNWCI